MELWETVTTTIEGWQDWVQAPFAGIVEPGPRGLPGSYAAYLRDPAGNKVTAYAFV